jgi:hypothetical protein
MAQIVFNIGGDFLFPAFFLSLVRNYATQPYSLHFPLALKLQWLSYQ